MTTLHENQNPIITVRALSGLAGDMLLAGLAALAQVDAEQLEDLVDELGVPALHGTLQLVPHTVQGIAGWRCQIALPDEHSHRSFAQIQQLILASALPEPAQALAVQAFKILAEAEAAVHGLPADQVTFHEVGALDSILDICLVCRLYVLLGSPQLVCSPLPVADGSIACAHGIIPAPAPAVLQMLGNVPVRGFAGEGETVTPTALALLKALNAQFGPWPSMLVQKTGISYGSKVFANAPNGAVWALGKALPEKRF